MYNILYLFKACFDKKISKKSKLKYYIYTNSKQYFNQLLFNLKYRRCKYGFTLLQTQADWMVWPKPDMSENDGFASNINRVNYYEQNATMYDTDLEVVLQYTGPKKCAEVAHEYLNGETFKSTINHKLYFLL